MIIVISRGYPPGQRVGWHVGTAQAHDAPMDLNELISALKRQECGLDHFSIAEQNEIKPTRTFEGSVIPVPDGIRWRVVASVGEIVISFTASNDVPRGLLYRLSDGFADRVGIALTTADVVAIAHEARRRAGLPVPPPPSPPDGSSGVWPNFRARRSLAA